jgi:Collagen triple helix repeat (20 copies)
MFDVSKIKKHFNPGTAIAFTALLFAITGVSFAATGGSGSGGGRGPSSSTLTATAAKSKAKTGPRGPRGLAGRVGPAGKNGATGAAGITGPVGPQGPTGATGAVGTPGGEGKEGKAGESVRNTTVPKGATACNALGGAEFKVGEAGKPTYACNAEGSGGGGGGFPGFLPKGKSETGAFYVHSVVAVVSRVVGTESIHEPEIEGQAVTAISFPVPLESVLSETNAFFIKKGQAGKEHAAECPGTVKEPAAAEGDLCVYLASENGVNPHSISMPIEGPEEEGAGKTGALLTFFVTSEESGSAKGTWAVTAP